MFLQALDKNKKGKLLKKLKDYEASISSPLQALGQSITVLKVQILIGDVFALPVNELEDLAARMVEIFCTNLPLSKELDAQDSMYGEELLSMASSLLVQT
ncbi:hypothetical protein OROGR_027753 [Orobanche gracilis]